MSISDALFEKAIKLIPGGVNSPVRDFQAVNQNPRFIDLAKDSHIFDIEGNKYIDLVNSWGAMILGHAHPQVVEAVNLAAQKGLSFGAVTQSEVEMAELIIATVPSIEMVRMVNSGTEAVMSAIRTARGYTGKAKIIKFAGCYHGHSDAMLVQAGSGAMTTAVPNSAGVTIGSTADTLVAEYNNLASVEALFAANLGQIAAIIVEPVAANMGVIPAHKDFLQGLRNLTRQHQAVLIFDEVITGYRLSLGGAQEYYQIEPDLTILGKIIGGGMPVGAYGGKKAIMQMVSPVGPVYQAGTLSGNPVAMAAGITQLQILQNEPEIYHQIQAKSERFFTSIQAIIKKYNAPCQINHVGSLGSLFFTPEPVQNYQDALKADQQAYGKYFAYMLAKGYYLAPSQYEAMFISHAHGDGELAQMLDDIEEYFANDDGI